jgi:hypothetical protein
MTRLPISILLTCAFASMGCATVFRGSTQPMRFTSEPNGVGVKVNNRNVGVTPIDVEVDRDRQPSIVLSKEGYGDGHVSLRKQLDTGWAVWDIGTCVIPITLCIPLLIDGFSGAWYSYDERYEVKLADPARGVAPNVYPSIKPGHEPGY